MEYFFGAITTLIVIVVTNRVLRSRVDIKKTNVPLIRYNQSHIYSLVKPLLPSGGFGFRPIKESQSLKYQKDVYIKIMVIENQAYWIKDNALFVAEMVNGELMKESSRQVDTMSMDKVQLERMMFVVEQLTEGSPNDHGGPRKS